MARLLAKDIGSWEAYEIRIFDQCESVDGRRRRVGRHQRRLDHLTSPTRSTRSSGVVCGRVFQRRIESGVVPFQRRPDARLQPESFSKIIQSTVFIGRWSHGLGTYAATPDGAVSLRTDVDRGSRMPDCFSAFGTQA